MIDSRTYRDCPVCGSGDWAYSYKHSLMPIMGVSVLDEFNVVVCKECGMTYADSTPRQEEIDLYYRKFSKYESRIATPGIKDKKIADHICSKPFDTSALIVDVGCGRGGLITELKNRGYNTIMGVELSAQNCDNVSSHGVAVINKSLYDLVPEDFPRKIDCIVLNAVLEHISDLHTAIKRLSNLLNTNGSIIVAVPCLDRFLNFCQYPFEELSMEHVNYFTLKSLEHLFKPHGLELNEYYRDRILLVADFCIPIAPENTIREYVVRCSEHLSPTVELIDRYVNSKTPIVIYGAGTLCQYLLANTRLALCNILQIVDGNKNSQGYPIGNLIIQSPSILCDGAYYNADILTISYRFNEEITASIRSMGLANVIVNLPLDSADVAAPDSETARGVSRKG